MTLTISRTEDHLTCFARQLGLESSDCQLDYDGPAGQFRIRKYPAHHELTLYVYETQVRQPIQLDTVNPAHSGLYCLFVNLSKPALNKVVNGEAISLHTQSASGGLFFHGPGVSISQQVSVQQPMTAVCLTININTLPSLTPTDDMLPPPGGFVFLELDVAVTNLLHELSQPAESGTLAEARKYPLTLDWLLRVFEQMQQRDTASSSLGLSQPDLDRLFAARSYLLAHLHEPLPQDELARQVGMSTSKLRQYFPRLFGQPIHQFWQNARLNHALDLLATRQYSVSEVGYRIGYSNLAHFTTTYRRQFGHNPSEFLRTVLHRNG